MKRLFEPTFDTISLLDTISFCQGFLVAVVPDSHVCPSFCERVCDSQTNSCTGACNYRCSTFEGEEWKDSIRGWGSGVVMMEVPSIHGAVHVTEVEDPLPLCMLSDLQISEKFC